MSAPARYWRVFFRSVNLYDYGQLGVRSMRFFDAADTNLSASLTSAQLSTTFPQFNSTSYPLTYLVDGDVNTAWVINWSGYRTTQNWYYVQFDFGAGNDVLPDYIEMYFDQTSYNGNTIIPLNSLDFVVDSSADNITYTRQAMHYRPITAALTNIRVPATVASTQYILPPRGPIGGSGGIYGIVSEDGVALPDRPVILLERDTFYRVGWTTTDENGGYAFNGLNTNREFMVMSYDPSGPPYKNALIWDRITPINTLGNITPQSAFWARRTRDQNLMSLWSVDNYLDGATYRFFGSNIVGNAEDVYDSMTIWTGYNFHPSSAVGGSLKFLRSRRTLTDPGLGMFVRPGEGFATGVNAAGVSANYTNLTFEYIFIAPTGTESPLIFVWGGTRESDDAAQWGTDGWIGQISRPSGPTLEVTNTAMNVRMNLSALNRATVRCTAPVTPGTMYHVMVTYAQDSEIKLYVNGALVQTTAIAGGGRLWGHRHAGNTTAQDWDYLYNTSYYAHAAIRRFTALMVCGYDRPNTDAYSGLQNMGAGWGGAAGLTALYNRTFSAAEVASFYDSFVNWDTHAVLPTQSGYMGEVEADNPVFYARLNDLGAVTRIATLFGQRDYAAVYEGTPGYNATGFVSGSTSITTSNGAAYTVGLDIPARFTVEFFCRPTSVAGTQRLWLARQYNSNPPMYLSIISGVLNFNVVDLTGTTTTWVMGYTLAVGTSYHIAVQYDPWTEKKVRLFVNGAMVYEAAGSVIPDTVGNSWIGIGCNVSGTGPSISERFQGQMAEFAIYQYMLPAARIQAHYDARNA